MTECKYCGHPIERVDLYGTEFFQHVNRKDCVVWRHVDKERNITHQAKPGD